MGEFWEICAIEKIYVTNNVDVVRSIDEKGIVHYVKW